MGIAQGLFSDGEAAPKRTYRPVAETLADVEKLRAEEPDITTAEVARKLGYPPKYIYKLLSANRKEGAAGKDAPAPTGAPGGGVGKARRDALITKLCDPLAKLAQGVAFAAPTVACVLIDRGEATARALVAIAEDKPRMLAALENVSKVGPVTDLAETLLCLVIAASLDTGRMPPTHPLAVLTGNTERYVKMHPKIMTEDAAPFPPFPFPAPGVPVA
jgi:hypothetical protein